jgi:hypothetical protein
MTERGGGGIQVGVGSSSNNRLMGSNYTIHTQHCSKKWFPIERDTLLWDTLPKKSVGLSL